VLLPPSDSIGLFEEFYVQSQRGSWMRSMLPLDIPRNTRFLCTKDSRPRHCGATDQRDEFASLHGLRLSAERGNLAQSSNENFVCIATQIEHSCLSWAGDVTLTMSVS